MTRGMTRTTLALLFLSATPTFAYTAYVTNERDDTMSVIDLDQMKTVKTVPVGQRPRGITITKDGSEILICASDDDTIQIVDTKTLRIIGNLPSGPDPETFALHVSGNPLYVSNEDDNLVTVIDVPTRKMIAQLPTGVEPEGMAVSPDGKTIVNTSETTNMAHFFDYASRKMVASVLVGARPRIAEFKHDGSEVWVSSELGGTVSVIDPKTHTVTHTIHFQVQGLRAEGIQPVAIRLKKYLLVGQRVWQMAFTPDGRYLLTTNGLSNDVSVIDVAGLEVIKSIPVGRLPWGVVVSPK